MVDFDGELYLRLLGERTLLDAERDGPGWRSSPFEEAAAAMIETELVEKRVADDALADYGLALVLRGDDGWAFRHGRQPRRSAPAASVTSPRLRLARCAAMLPQTGGTLELHYASLATDRTSVAVTIRQDTLGRPGGRSRGGSVTVQMRAGGGPLGRTVLFEDDRGHTSRAHFSGGGSPEEMTGHLTLEQPLAVDSRWMKVDGTRVELGEHENPAEIRIEPIERSGSVMDYLWRRLTQSNDFHEPPDLEPAINVFLAAGAIESEDPALAELRGVAARLGHVQLPGSRGGSTRLPEQWESLFARQGRFDGPVGGVLIGASTPSFDGVAASLLQLNSDSEGFSLEAELVGAFGAMSPFDSLLEGPGVSWWASDDCGNQYLGHVGSSGGGDEMLSAEVDFTPALDPKARELEVTICARAERALIRFPLAWNRPPTSEVEPESP